MPDETAAKSTKTPTFDVYQSEADGVTVVHVETHGMPEDSRGPVIRVYLNDEPIFENPPLPMPEEQQPALGVTTSSDDASAPPERGNSMRQARDLSRTQLIDIVSKLQMYLYLDMDASDREFWNVDKERSCADVRQELDLIFGSYGLVPEPVNDTGSADAS